MSDLRMLLHEAAPRPSRPIDIEALVAEANRRKPWRRIGLWFASIVALVGATGGAVGVLSPADRPSRVVVIPPPAERIVDVDDEGTDSVAAAPAVDHEGSAAHTPSADVAAPAASPDTAAAAAPFSDEGCFLGQPPGGYGTLYSGFDDPSVRDCMYTATQAGGFSGTGTWSITVQRGSDKITRSHLNNDTPCADVGFIQPGDAVTVSTRSLGTATTGGTSIGAGPGWDCSARSDNVVGRTPA